MESGIEPNSSRESTPKRYSSDADSMASSSKRSRNLSDSRSSSDIVVVDPHPDLVSLNDTPIVRLVTTNSPKMARMIDLLLDKEFQCLRWMLAGITRCATVFATAWPCESRHVPKLEKQAIGQYNASSLTSKCKKITAKPFSLRLSVTMNRFLTF